jgi:hypothetical protein
MKRDSYPTSECTKKLDEKELLSNFLEAQKLDEKGLLSKF